MDLADEWKLKTDLSGARWAEIDFRDFVTARSAALFRGALVLTGNREAAEDLVQETLERAWPRWRTIAAKDAPDAYVRRIMVNLANDRWRRFRRTVAHSDNGHEAAPGDEYARVDSRDRLVRALQVLPMRMRTVVVLRYFHNLVRCRDRGRPRDLTGLRPFPALPGHRPAQAPVPRTPHPFIAAAHGRIPMTSNDARPSGCTGYTPFEEELVKAMRDFANNTDAPEFAPTTIMRGARRRTRSLVTAGIAAVFILAGGGTAFAVTAGSGPNTGHEPYTSAHPATSSCPSFSAHPATGSSPSASARPEPSSCAATGAQGERSK